MRNERRFRVGSAAAILVATGLLVLTHASSAPVAAQIPQETPGSCPQGRIAEIYIDNQSVFDMSDPNRGGGFAWAYRLANGLHIRTRDEVIRRELLFKAGDCLDPQVLSDSERLLRNFPFLADADIYAVRRMDGDVQVLVDTRDEWSTRVEPRVDSDGGVGLRGLRLVEDNVLGTGQHLGIFYEREHEESVFGVSYYTPQLFDTRWNLGAQMARTEVGHSYHGSLTYPFVGEMGRTAFRAVADRQDRHFELLMPNGEDALSRVWVPVSRKQFEVGAAFRWGRERYRHTLLGAALAAERVEYPSPATIAASEPDEMQVSPLIMPMDWRPVSSIRLMMLTGQRNVYYRRMRAIDTVNGSEDVQLGVEAEASFGPTIPMFSDEKDIAVGLRLFAADEVGGRAMMGGQIIFEGRRTYETLESLPEWHDLLAEADLWAYARLSPDSRSLWVFTLSAIGGWHSRVPFQLSLGGDAGLRGYPRHVDPGGRRVVAAIEHRAYLGWPLPELFDLGSVVFLDIGRIWPGDAPFGHGSAMRASIGAGLRAAFPPGSRQTLRLDVGFPIENGAGFRDLTVTIGVGQAIGRTLVRRDPQILRSARYGLSMRHFEYDDRLP